MEGYKLLKDGQEVEFDTETCDVNRTKAVNVTVVNK